MTAPFDIGAAVIGTGFIGTVHIGALRRLGVRVEGVLGSSAARGVERASALGTRAYGSLDDLLADPAVQVVHVTSPNVAHYGQVRQILAAGRHVVCEKPLAMTSAQSAEMLTSSSRSLELLVSPSTRGDPCRRYDGRARVRRHLQKSLLVKDLRLAV